MVDRTLMRDVALAVLLAVPTMAFSRPQAPSHSPAATTSPLIARAVIVERGPAEKFAAFPN